MRLDLKVPFTEKDQAKKLGARWDAARKTWYIEGKEDTTPFSRWSPTPHTASSGKRPASQGTPERKREESGKVYTGSQYVDLAGVCQCLPWEVCDRCRSSAFSSERQAS